ncbi:DUF3408 domain-containing protein [uncultured Duncaniella sp.]|uniref:DUF3408 domain-containing protein n=1 Tax=uncultured Duncaniella sp. TaxID=2768039 RepID=UPI002729C81D|nr:DUF3408 domain-containing protein [uncultured Duncaniella sp.]
MKTTKAPSTPASKSTELTDAAKSKVSTLNPDFIMKSDNSINSTSTVNSDNIVDSTTPANADNLFDNEQIATEVTSTIEPPKQQRIGKQQRKSDFAEFKATFLAPAKLVNRHALNIEGDLWDQLERVSRILGDRGTTVSSYANAILAEHLKQYADDIEIWRKL